jgi:cyanophycinase
LPSSPCSNDGRRCFAAIARKPGSGTIFKYSIGLAAAACLVATQAAAWDPFGVRTKGDGWIYTRLGNQQDVQTPTTGGVMFEGGGTDVDRGYQWMCQKAGNGDFLVLRATGTADYNPYIRRLCPGINSVSTLRIAHRWGTHNAFVLNAIAHAEAIFIAGGSQAQYVRFWQNTPVNAAINAAAARGVPVGGTSAGNAILAHFAFSALNGTVFSANALQNCYGRYITIDQGFLGLSPLLNGVITDDHFVTRNRMGRLVTFLARIVQDGDAAPAFAIAVNEHTAFLMEADGRGRIEGDSTAYFLRTPGAPQVCASGAPVTYGGIAVYRIDHGGNFNVATWTGSGGTAYEVSATGGKMSSTQADGRLY